MPSCNQRIATEILSSLFTECSALNGNKTKHYIYLTVNCIGEIDTLSNTGPHNVSYVLSKSQYGHH